MNRDLNEKRTIYQNQGVLEYIVVAIDPAEFHWFVGPDEARALPQDGILRSVTFPGLWIDTRAVLEDRIEEMKHALEQGLQQPEHRAFVERLRLRQN